VDSPAGEPVPPFKVCTFCATIWQERSAFLADPSVRVIGYTAYFQEIESGLFLFNHNICKTTLAIEASRFTDLYDGPVFAQPVTGTTACPSYCLRRSELRRCLARCECAYVRDVLDKVARWEKVAPG
jgi:hypothetical protein